MAKETKDLVKGGCIEQKQSADQLLREKKKRCRDYAVQIAQKTSEKRRLQNRLREVQSSQKEASATAGRFRSELSAAEDQSFLGLTNRSKINRLRSRLDESRQAARRFGQQAANIEKAIGDVQVDLVKLKSLAMANDCGSLA